MAVELTSERAVALYDTTTEWAFGEVFESRDHAEDFLRWLAEKPRREVLAPFSASHFNDPRVYDNDVLRQLQQQWMKERCNSRGELRALLEEVDNAN